VKEVHQIPVQVNDFFSWKYEGTTRHVFVVFSEIPVHIEFVSSLAVNHKIVCFFALFLHVNIPFGEQPLPSKHPAPKDLKFFPIPSVAFLLSQSAPATETWSPWNKP